MRQAVSAVVVSLFAVVFLHAAWAIRFLNPVFSRYLGVGLPGGPNVLLTVRGRSSGRWRRTPVAMMEFRDRRFVQAAFGEVGWVRNLRAAGQAVVTKGRHADSVDAVELAPETAGAIMHEALLPYARSRLVRAVVGDPYEVVVHGDRGRSHRVHRLAAVAPRGVGVKVPAHVRGPPRQGLVG